MEESTMRKKNVVDTSLQLLERQGIRIVPYSYLQRRLKNTNVRALVMDNVAFKLSFGATFALAAFAEF